MRSFGNSNIHPLFDFISVSNRKEKSWKSKALRRWVKMVAQPSSVRSTTYQSEPDPPSQALPPSHPTWWAVPSSHRMPVKLTKIQHHRFSNIMTKNTAATERTINITFTRLDQILIVSRSPRIADFWLPRKTRKKITNSKTYRILAL